MKINKKRLLTALSATIGLSGISYQVNASDSLVLTLKDYSKVQKVMNFAASNNYDYSIRPILVEDNLQQKGMVEMIIDDRVSEAALLRLVSN